MAEFVQTIKEWQRMCNTIKSCDDCPMQKEDGWTYVLCSEGGMSSARPEVAEKVIEKWAKENPEPVYPSWIDWLMSEGVIPTNYMAANSTDSGVRAGTFYVTSKAFEHIPADIAEKLGLQPKDGA